ncbi:MAG TPA: substrate-binding domain-containing protein [Anaeromyxobacter sp.]|nr:substrate-binding domain-containing protein [Anaeromyxobacter sp.]
MGLRIAVAAVSFTWNFTRSMLAELKKCAGPEHELIEVGLVRREDDKFLHQRFGSILTMQPKVDAVISLTFGLALHEVNDFRHEGIPIITVDEEGVGSSEVSCDNVKAGYLAGRHLIETGRKALALLAGPSVAPGAHYNAVRRRQGFERALAEAGMRLPPERFASCIEYSRKDGVSALESFLKSGQPIDGIFCAAGDAAAGGILAAAREHKLAIPADLAVVGFDDLPTAAISDPPLTTIRQPTTRIAQEALRLATQKENFAAILEKPETIHLEPTLVKRGST